MTQLLSIILRGIEKMGTSNEDKESVIRCKDCLFFEHDSIYVDGIMEILERRDKGKDDRSN